MNFISINHFQHEEESRRRTIRLLILFFSKFPVSHNIPDNLILIDGRFLKFFVLEVDNLEKSEHIRLDSFAINTEFLNNPLLYIPKCIVRFHPDKYTITNREVYRNRDLSFTHESHQLVFYGHVTDRWRIVDSSQHFPEKISQIFLLFIWKFVLLEAFVDYEKTCIHEILVRYIDVKKYC